MPSYRMVYGDDTQVVRETLRDVNIEREDGWLVFFQGRDVVLRVQEEHVESLDEVADDTPD